MIEMSFGVETMRVFSALFLYAVASGKLFWVDMEMTGLDPDTCVILEVAAIVTDVDLHEIAEYEAVVRQPPEALAAMDDWNKKHHGASGLIERVKASTIDAATAEAWGLVNRVVPDAELVAATDDTPDPAGPRTMWMGVRSISLRPSSSTR